MQKKTQITKESIKEVLNNITPTIKDRHLKIRVMFNNEQQAEDWLKMFHDLIREEAKKMVCNLDKNKNNDNEKTNYLNQY